MFSPPQYHHSPNNLIAHVVPSRLECFVSYWIDPQHLIDDGPHPYILPSLTELRNLDGPTYGLRREPSTSSSAWASEEELSTPYGFEHDLTLAPDQPPCTADVGVFFFHQPSRRAFIRRRGVMSFVKGKGVGDGNIGEENKGKEDKWIEKPQQVFARFFTDANGRVGLDAFGRAMILLCTGDVDVGVKTDIGFWHGEQPGNKVSGGDAETTIPNTDVTSPTATSGSSSDSTATTTPSTPSIEIYNWSSVDFYTQYSDDGRGVVSNWLKVYRELLDVAVRQQRELVVRREWPDWAD